VDFLTGDDVTVLPLTAADWAVFDGGRLSRPESKTPVAVPKRPGTLAASRGLLSRSMLPNVKEQIAR